MNAFNTLNGIPATGDVALQRDLLKGAWAFEGVLVSDWGSAIEMIDHGFAEDSRDAARLSILAGCDVDMESYVYLDHLEELVVSGEIDVALIDDAVRRTLRLKFELGLFDDPYRYLDKARERDTLMSAPHLEASLQMARKSIVLLKNEDGALPLRKSEKIALIGALASDRDAPLGNWRSQAEPHSAMSVLQGFEQAGLDFSYARGVAVQIGDADFTSPVIVNTDNRDGIEDAVAAASKAEKVVIVLGETALQSGEGRSRADLGLPGLQQELLEAVYAVNKNVVLVVMSGRPLVLSWADAHVPAIVQAWHLGHRSGQAITEVVTGLENPSGKLPMSFPRAVGQLPLYYNHLSTGRPNRKEQVVWAHYSDIDISPLYPFGHGLSYSSFTYSGLQISAQADHVSIEVTVRNESEIDGEEVVQLYLRDRVASVARPVRELKAFEKILIEAGECRTIKMKLGAKDLGFYGPSGDFRLEPGDFDIFVGGSSQAALTGTIRLSCDQLKALR